MRWVPEPSANAPTQSGHELTRSGERSQLVTEGTVLRIWERASGRSMSPDERQKARGHALVAYLSRFSEADLSATANAALGRSRDLDWREWRRAVERLEASRESTDSAPTRVAPKVAKQQAKKQAKGKGQVPSKQQGSPPGFTNPDDSREIRTGAWKGRSPRSVKDAELMKRLKKKYPNL